MSYQIPEDATDSPQAIAARLIDQYSEFTHLKDGQATFGFLLRLDEEYRNGRQVLGMASLPQVQGRLKSVFTWMLGQTMAGGLPDFLIILDDTWWQQADAQQREILVFHELNHCVHKQDRDGVPRYDSEGGPVWGIAEHDVEEFTATVARYGAYSQEIRAFIEAAQGVA